MTQPTFLLYGHGGSGNRGCEAIVRGTAALLAEACPGARVALCSERPQSDAALLGAGVSRVTPSAMSPRSLDRVLASVGYRLSGDRDAYLARTQTPVLRAARRAAVCLSIGGDTYCYHPPASLYAVNRRLRARGKPTALWGCSVDPERLTGELLEDLKRYTALFARESITYQAMLDAGLSPTRAADPAFALAAETVDAPPGFVPGNTVGINVSPLALGHAKAGAGALGALNAIEALIRHILKTTDCAVALTSHVRWRHDDDMQPLGALAEVFLSEPRVLTLDPEFTAPQIKGLIARMRCLVAARTHASIAAYSTAVPALVLGYSVKARGIARDLYGREEGHVLPVQELASEAELIAAFDGLLAREQAERALLRDQAPKQLELARAAADTVAAWAQDWRAARP
ncbi:MAG: polysaccharide pyruvyl transferase family protein [Clostridia bacterium]|nr:polysaccharide pyruvyl transferase family protein [Clostridia bacterium]